MLLVKIIKGQGYGSIILPLSYNKMTKAIKQEIALAKKINPIIKHIHGGELQKGDAIDVWTLRQKINELNRDPDKAIEFFKKRGIYKTHANENLGDYLFIFQTFLAEYQV